MSRCKAPEILRSEAYLNVRRSDEGWGKRSSWAFFSSLQNKKPSLRMKDWVFFYFTLHSPPPKTCCEARSGRFSGSRIVLLGLKSSSYFRPPCPFPSCTSRRIVDLASFVPDYSGVAVPDSHGVSSSASSHLNTDQFLVISYHSFYVDVKSSFRLPLSFKSPQW